MQTISKLLYSSKGILKTITGRRRTLAAVHNLEIRCIVFTDSNTTPNSFLFFSIIFSLKRLRIPWYDIRALTFNK